eukprot:scaffold346_cov387-Prasinococcus_capsulatus_cf.AAC.20
MVLYTLRPRPRRARSRGQAPRSPWTSEKRRARAPLAGHGWRAGRSLDAALRLLASRRAHLGRRSVDAPAHVDQADRSETFYLIWIQRIPIVCTGTDVRGSCELP